MAGYKKTPNARPIINITIPEELLEKIEDHRFEYRISNRSQAVCQLIEWGFKRMLSEKQTNEASEGEQS